MNRFRLLLFLALAGGVSAPSSRAAETPLRVVASTSILADLTRQIGSNRVDVIALSGALADPHAFDPTPAQIQLALRADLVLVNGAGLETGLLKALRDARADRNIVEASAGVRLLSGSTCCPHDGHGDDHDHEHAHAEDGVDPHVWFDPLRVRTWATNIAEAVATRRPETRAEIERNRDQLVRRLEDLDGWIRSRVATLPRERRVLVMDHAFLGYFADRYGFPGIRSLTPGSSTLAQPSAKDLAEAVLSMRKAGVPALFVEAGTAHALASQVARETGAAVVPLHSCSLGPAGSGAETYERFMRHNVDAIVEALGRGKP